MLKEAYRPVTVRNGERAVRMLAIAAIFRSQLASGLKTFSGLIVEQTPIEISGFSAPEIDQILLGDDPPPHAQGPLDPAPGAIAVAREGDFFRLGEHRIVCGYATANDVFVPLMRAMAQPGSS
jgi:hypothetical protein